MNTPSKATTSTQLTRRNFLRLSGLGAGALVLGGCGPLSPQSQQSGSRTSGQGSLPQVTSAAATGRLREYAFEAAPMEVSLGGRTAQTWGYEGGLPGPEIRVTEGDTLRVRLNNRLPAETTIHWHGLAIVNGMDGVPNVTQPPVADGEEFTYEFEVPHAGSYMYHSHVGLQLDRGLYGPLVVEPKQEELSYDREYTLMLDDWLDGVSGTPEEALNQLTSGGTMGSGGGMMGGDQGGSALLVPYPLYLINGRTSEDPETLKVRRGEKLRLRLMNPAADTVFRVAVAGHRLTVTHADGLPVERVNVDSLIIAPGERYDVLVAADNPGVWQIAAAPESKDGLARAILRYEENGVSSAPPPDARPAELGGKLLSYGDLRNAVGESFPQGGLFSGPDRTRELTLSGGMGDYAWAIDGQTYPDAEPLKVSEGEWVRFKLRNQSMMAHPMHLHGHFFQLQNGTGQGPFKDTVLVASHGEATFDFATDNPGDWFFHCHLAYHLETGMARVVTYGE
ncbi:MAG: multicopper oxidase family protein [Rubrobacteraceae bacterium]